MAYDPTIPDPSCCIVGDFILREHDIQPENLPDGYATLVLKRSFNGTDGWFAIRSGVGGLDGIDIEVEDILVPGEIYLRYEGEPANNGNSGSTSSGSFSSGSSPSGSIPSGSLPSGSIPSGSNPSGSVSSGSIPSGSIPSGSIPSGSMPSGSVPSGSVPSGSVPSGSVPSGSVPSGSIPSGSVPSGSVPSGSIPDGEDDDDDSSIGGPGGDPNDNDPNIGGGTFPKNGGSGLDDGGIAGTETCITTLSATPTPEAGAGITHEFQWYLVNNFAIGTEPPPPDFIEPIELGTSQTQEVKIACGRTAVYQVDVIVKADGEEKCRMAAVYHANCPACEEGGE